MRKYVCIIILFFCSESLFAQTKLLTNFYSDKLKKESEGYVNEKGQRNGEWKFWSVKGKLERTENFKDGLLDGVSVLWHNDSSYSKSFLHNDQLDSSFSYVNEIILAKLYRNQKINSDSTIRFDDKGNIMFVHTSRTLQEGISTSILGCNYNNKLELEICDTIWLDSGSEKNVSERLQQEDTLIYEVVEQSAEFPGGMEALYKFISRNVEYPKKASKEGVNGKVYVQFTVEKDGSITDVHVVRGIGSGCDEEAVRVVKMMPEWKSGKQRGQPVRTRYKLPVSFKL